MTRKPVVLLDCDGVLADFTAAALDLIEEETGKVLTPQDIPRWDIFESLGLPELWKKFNEKAAQIGYCESMKACPGAAAAVKKLMSKYNVFVVTAPVDALPWMYERTKWLKKKCNIDRENVIFAHAKQRITGDVLVDDKPQNISAWLDENPNGLGVLWEHAYNSRVVLPEGAIRTSDWKELHSILEDWFGAD